MAQAKKGNKKKSSSSSSKLQSWLRPSTPLRGMVLFALVFAITGGTFFAFKSFAATPGGISASSVSGGKDVYGCPKDINSRPTIAYGSSGACVKRAQDALGWILNRPLAIDGQFGQNTKDAVKVFQTNQRITADGIVGPQTWFLLDAQIR